MEAEERWQHRRGNRGGRGRGVAVATAGRGRHSFGTAVGKVDPWRGGAQGGGGASRGRCGHTELAPAYLPSAPVRWRAVADARLGLA